MSMFTAPEVTAGGDFTPLEDGCYEAVVVGLRGFTGTKYQSDEPEDKMQFVFQVRDDEGTLHYLTTKPLTNVLNDKSNLFKVLNGITGYGLDKFPVGFQYTALVNGEKPVKCQLTVKTVASKKDPNKTFNEIDGYLKAKKGQKTTFVPDDKAPAWLNQNVKEVFWIPGLSFLPPQENKAAGNAKSAANIPPAVATQLGDSSAFFGQGQVSNGFATPNSEVPVSGFPQQAGPVSAPSPYVPPQPKQAPQQGQYVPPAAPAPQQQWPAPQAPQVQVDDDNDLPF